MDIAVVDDEKMIREHIREMIENQQPDCDVACFSSGEELLVATKPFDIIFLDVQMDGMNGIEAQRKQERKILRLRRQEIRRKPERTAYQIILIYRRITIVCQAEM